RIGRANDPIVELLKLDSRFFRYYQYIVDLDREAGLVPQAVAVWDELTAARAGDAGAAARGAQASEAATLVAEIDDLVGEAAGEADIREEAQELLLAAKRAARPVSQQGPFAAETARLGTLGVEARRLRSTLVDA